MLFEFGLFLYFTGLLILQSFNIHVGHTPSQYNFIYTIFGVTLFLRRILFRLCAPSLEELKMLGISSIIRLIFSLSLLWGVFTLYAKLLTHYSLLEYFKLSIPFSFQNIAYGFTHRLIEGDSDPEGVVVATRHVMVELMGDALEAMYYAGYLPAVFVNDVNAIYDERRILFFVAIFFVDTLCFLLLYMLATHGTVLMKTSRSLGDWEYTPKGIKGAPQWVRQVWPPGSIVRHDNKYYRASSTCHFADPSDREQKVFVKLFTNPQLIITPILLLQISLITAQITLLFFAQRFSLVLVLSVSLLLNYLIVVQGLVLHHRFRRETQWLDSKMQ